MVNHIRAEFTPEEITLANRLAVKNLRRGMLPSDAFAAADLTVRWSKPTVERIQARRALEEATGRAIGAALDAWTERTRR